METKFWLILLLYCLLSFIVGIASQRKKIYVFQYDDSSEKGTFTFVYSSNEYEAWEKVLNELGKGKPNLVGFSRKDIIGVDMKDSTIVSRDAMQEPKGVNRC